MKNIHLIFLGAPGTGKGTQAKLLTQKINITQISTGDILREEIKRETELGKKAKEYIVKGQLVPDELIIDIIRDKFSSPNFPNNWIMDGFPRTIRQAQSFDKLLEQFNLTLSKVIDFIVPVDILIDRLSNRRVCKNCGQMYNLLTNPPKIDNNCDICKGELYQRDDDNVDTIKQRMKEYTLQTAPLINYYKDKNLYYSINADRSIEQIQRELIDLLNNL